MTGALRIGIAGAGAWSALAHIPAVLANPDAVLAGVADPDPARLAATSDHHGIRERYADASRLIADADLDALVVASPNATHGEIALAALDAGLHVLIEKPMTVRAADARDLAQRAQASGLHLVVGYTNQFTPGAVAARALVRAGGIGEISLVSGLFTSSIEDFLMGRPGEETDYARVSPIGGPSPSTYADPALSGGGYGQSQATHALGMALWITGLRARRANALMSSRAAGVDVIDAIIYELANGGLGTLAASGALGQLQAEQQEQWYYGTQGTLRQDFLTGLVTFLPRDGGPVRSLAPAVQTDSAAVFGAPLDCLVDLVLGRSAENHAPAAAGVAAVELLEAAYTSAAAGGSGVEIGSGLAA